MSQYPEHEKLKLVQDNSQTVGEFLEFLGEKDLVVCKYQETTPDEEEGWDGPEGYWPDRTSKEKLLAEFFDIDLIKLEAEKVEMIKSMKQ